MKLFTILAATLGLASSGQIYNQVPAEVYQASEYQQPQNLQQNGWQAIDGGYQGQQLDQAVQHQPAQHQSIQTYQVQTVQPQQYQYESQPQQYQYENQPQQYQSQQQHLPIQPEHVQIQPQHVQTQPQHINFNQHSQIGQSFGQLYLNGHQSQNSGEHQRNRQAKILSFQHDSDGHNYQYAYETENGIKAQEVGSTSGEHLRIQGAYSYNGDDGKVYTVSYTADENGFHPSGEHLPTPPPVPEAIARSIEQNQRDEANGIVDDGQYHQEQQHEQFTQQSQQHQQKQVPPQGLFQQVQRHNYEQTQQEEPTKPQKQEYSQQKQQQQQAIRLPSPRLKQRILQKQEHQKEISQEVQQQQEPQVEPEQQNIHQQLLPQKTYLKFQRQQRPDHPQTLVSVVKSVEPHVEQHGQVEYAIPSLHTDDYFGPAPAPVSAPVTKNQY